MMIENQDERMDEYDRKLAEEGERMMAQEDQEDNQEMQEDGDEMFLGVIAMAGKKEKEEWGEYGEPVYDEISGKPLDRNLVYAARLEEMAEFRKHKVYKKVSVEKCRR